MPLLFPDAVQSDYIPWLIFRGGRTGNAGQYQTDRGPFTNENVTHDVIANITKVWGSHAAKAGFYYQNSFKPQSIFASFNSQIDFTDNGSNPFDTGYSYANAATGVFNSYTQASKYALPEWRYKNFEWYAQDNWKPSNRFTLDYGLRFYYLTPQWDTTLQASNFLPDQFSTSGAATLFHARSASARRPVRTRAGEGWTRRSLRRVSRRPWATRSTSVHRPADPWLEPVQRRVPGRSGHQRPAAEWKRLQSLASHRGGVRPDGERRDDHPRWLRDLLRPAAGEHGVRHDLQRAGRAELDAPPGDSCRV